MSTPLSAFRRNGTPDRTQASTRLGAALLTLALYALFVVLAWWSSASIRTSPATAEITATILQDRPTKRAVVPLPPFLAHLIRPRAEKPALPVFTIATGAPPQAPVPLPASAAVISPLQGGTSGNGPMGQAASGNGTGGNGGALAGCLDPEWMQAVTERVRQFFYYPTDALATRRTGVVMVRFVVRGNGQVDRLEIDKPSGDAELDKAAIDIMRKAQPLPPIPARMHLDRVDGRLPINFGLRSFHGGGSMGNCRG